MKRGPGDVLERGSWSADVVRVLTLSGSAWVEGLSRRGPAVTRLSVCRPARVDVLLATATRVTDVEVLHNASVSPTMGGSTCSAVHGRGLPGDGARARRRRARRGVRGPSELPGATKSPGTFKARPQNQKGR